MRIQSLNFLLLCFLICVGFGPVASAQMFDGEVEEQADAGAAEDDIFGFGGEDQQPNAEDLAVAEAEAQRLNQEAAEKKAAGDTLGALDLYEEAATASPNFTSYLEIARILVEQDDHQRAIQYYMFAAQFAGTLEDPSAVLPVLLEVGQAYLDTEQFNSAIGAFRQAMSLPKQSRNKEILYKLGMAQTEFAINQQYATTQTRQEQLLQGLDYFDKAILIDPDYADALYERGNTHLLMGDADKALEDLGRAVQLDPENTDAMAQLGFVSLQRGLSESARRNGQTAKILFDLNRSVEYLTRWLEVVPADQEVDEEDPEAIRRENVLLNRSAAYVGLGDEHSEDLAYYQQAISDANAAIDIEPEMPDAYFQKGLGLRMLGELDDALEAFTEAIELSLGDPRANAPEGLLRRGIIYFQQNDLELAKSDFEKSIRYTARGFNPRAYFWLGLCHQKQGNVNQAVREYTRALRLSPRFSRAYFNRGLAYMHQGRFERATGDFNEVLRIDRNNEQARSLRSQAMEQIEIR